MEHSDFPPEVKKTKEAVCTTLSIAKINIIIYVRSNMIVNINYITQIWAHEVLFSHFQAEQTGT